ncbi:hypothetical protein HYY27_01900 [bacterium]|nr:hypothetical protein [bacterium]
MKENPFDRSMFDSYASGGEAVALVCALVGVFLLLALLYTLRSRLRGRGPDSGDVEDQDLSEGRRGLLGRLIRMVFGRRAARQTALSHLVKFDPPSVNCTIRRTADGQEVNRDAGRAVLLHLNGEIFLREKAFFIAAPDGIKAGDQGLFTGQGEVVNLWFLHERIPYTFDCEVAERVRFPSEMARNMDPQIGVGYRLVPLTNVAKRDERQAIRFSHKVGRGALRVYPQILFDVYVQKTAFRYPTEGSIPPRINDLKLIPYKKPREEEEEDFSVERVVAAFKEMIRLNPPESRVVHVSKPHMDERTNRRILLDLGHAEVVGLNASEAGRVIHVKRPVKSARPARQRRDPHFLSEGDIVVLDYLSRSQGDDRNEYHEMVCQVIKGGIENVTLRPRRAPRRELNLPVEMLDFSVNGLRFENSEEFMRYVFGEDWKTQKSVRQRDILEGTGLIFTFYPRLRFTRDTEAYRPDLPLKFSILGRIVRCETQREERGAESGPLKAFGVRYTHDPAEYSMDNFCWDRWVMIRPPFRENHHFKEVHKSLNGLIAHLENQPRDLRESPGHARRASREAERQTRSVPGSRLQRKG